MTLLYRAEAKVILGEYEQATNDLAMYYRSKGATEVITQWQTSPPFMPKGQ